MKKPWSVRTINTRKGQYAIVTGKAYPSVMQGQNPTRVIQSALNDREAFYRDPAVRLTTSDLDALDGAEGAPMCVEHDINDVVGSVHHTFIDNDDPQKGWKIMARIPLNDRGKKVVADIKAGKLNGFSVGYRNSIDYDGKTRTNRLDSKEFREISLVNEPFFDGCNLSVSVTASKTEKGKNYGNNLSHLHSIPYFYTNFKKLEHIFVPFGEMSEVQDNNTATPTQETPAPTSEPSVPLREMESMVKQTDMLKEQLNEKQRALEAAEVAKSEAAKAAMSSEERAELDALRAEKKAQLEAYKAANMPKAEEYMKWREEQDGSPLTETEKKVYLAAFTNPQYKRDGERFERDMRRTVDLAASKKALEDERLKQEESQKNEMAKLLAEKQKLTELIGQGSANMRATYAAMMSQKNESLTEEPKTLVGVNASRANPGEILNAKPSEHEMGFLSEYNFTNQVNVNASKDDPWAPEQRFFRQTLPSVPRHTQLVNEHGELNFPDSWRYTNETVMSWLVNESGLADADTSNYVSINTSRTFMEPKRVE